MTVQCLFGAAQDLRYCAESFSAHPQLEDLPGREGQADPASHSLAQDRQGYQRFVISAGQTFIRFHGFGVFHFRFEGEDLVKLTDVRSALPEHARGAWCFLPLHSHEPSKVRTFMTLHCDLLLFLELTRSHPRCGQPKRN